jgi:hypothetical protein
MDQPENYYSVLGVTKANTDLEVRQAYNILMDSLRAKATLETQALAKQRMQLLDEALNTLLNPDKKKRHDEKLDWYLARSRAAADREREAAARLKLAQEAALEARKAAMAAEQEAANAAARREREEVRRREELARVEAEAAERFRRLREERKLFAPAEVAPLPAEEDATTQPMELAPQAQDSSADAALYLRAVGRKAALGGLLAITCMGLAYWLLRPAKPSAPVLPPLAQQAAPAAAAAASAPLAALPEAPPPAANPEPGQKKDGATAAQTAAPAGAAKPAKVDSAKAAEQLQYQKILRRVEEEHPELNPDRAGHRADLVAYVASRVSAHVREGYPRSKALDIAVRDLETQEQAKHMLEKFRNSKEAPPPQATAVLDKGEHQGYDPKCRWVTPEQWSCK